MSRHAYFEGVCERGRILFKKIEKALSGWTYIEFLNHLCRYRYGKIEWSQLKSDIANIFGNSGVSGDLVHEFNDFIRFFEKTTILKKAGSPSYYWVLNENEDITKASQRTELEHQVLNDTFICVNLDSKNCARKWNIEEHEHDGGITEEELWNEFEDVNM